MSVTNHNSLWGDASEFGRFMKVETTDYSGSNTSSDDSADDYNRYQNVTTEFYQLNEDGTPKLDGSNNPIPLAEQSGGQLVTRIYGDVYFYNTGNEYTWGGTGTTFNFGNGYEENHIGVSDPYVPSDEVFNLPETDSSNWNTSKTWGKEYSYNKGAEYSWQEGYADSSDTLKNNHFCSYSIGLAYEESYTVAPGGKTVASAKSGFTSSHDDWSSSSLGLSAASLGVSKSYGDSYEYTCGKGFSIQEGDTEEHVYGASTSYVHGDSHEYVGEAPTSDASNPLNITPHKANSYSTVYGDSTETVHGDSTSTVYGITTDHHWGTSNEILGGGGASLNMGGMIEMTLGAVQETTASAKLEIFLGAVMEMTLGAKIEIDLGFAMEVKAGGKMEFGEMVDLKANAGANVNANSAQVNANASAQVNSQAVQVNVP